MSEPLVVDLFVEDRAHEVFVGALTNRIAREEQVAPSLQAIAPWRLGLDRWVAGDAGRVRRVGDPLRGSARVWAGPGCGGVRRSDLAGSPRR